MQRFRNIICHVRITDNDSRRRDLALIVVFAVAFRLAFLALTSDTYDYDEFVLLLLARDVSHGNIPYHDFLFFHPPAMLYLLRLLEPFTRLWWPSGRVAIVLVDTVTAGMVWRLGLALYGRRGGIVSGLIYACSPLALLGGARVGQDTLLTALGIGGLTLLITRPGRCAAAGAGVFLGAAICVKYPAVNFLPVYVLAAPRRVVVWLTTAIAAFAICLAPLHDHLGAVYQQTVTFQRTRWSMDLGQRLQTTGLYWLLANPVAPVAVFLERVPVWLLAGFGLGGVFVLNSQVYYHYFVPVAPFATLLATPLVLRLGRHVIPGIVSIGIAVAIGWGVVIGHSSNSMLYVTTARLSDISATVHWLKTHTAPGDAVLADRYEYAYLADRPAYAHYFWNVGVLVDAHFLLQRLPRRGAVVLSYGASSGYPPGLTTYLDRHYARRHIGITDVWLLSH